MTEPGAGAVREITGGMLSPGSMTRSGKQERRALRVDGRGPARSQERPVLPEVSVARATIAGRPGAVAVKTAESFASSGYWTPLISSDRLATETLSELTT